MDDDTERSLEPSTLRGETRAPSARGDGTVSRPSKKPRSHVEQEQPGSSTTTKSNEVGSHEANEDHPPSGAVDMGTSGLAVYVWGGVQCNSGGEDWDDEDSDDRRKTCEVCENGAKPVLHKCIRGEPIQQVKLTRDGAYFLTTNGTLKKNFVTGTTADIQVMKKPLRCSCIDHTKIEFQPVSSGQFSTISSNWSHNAAISRREWHLFTWGNGDFGKLGLEDEADRETPTPVEAHFFQYIPIKLVSCGSRHTLAVTTEGRIYSWGKNSLCGDGTIDDDQLEPQSIRKLDHEEVYKISTMDQHSAVVSRSGKVFTWGIDDTLILGHNENWLEPHALKLAKELGEVKDLSCGVNHSALIDEKGTVHVWGKNDHGQLGLGNKDEVGMGLSVPTGLEGRTMERVYCANQVTFCIASDGALFSWGQGQYGTLGHGSYDDVLVPTQVQAFQSLRVVDLFLKHSDAVALVDPTTLAKTDMMTLGQACSTSLNDREFSDVTFMVQGKPIHAHKVILVQRSSVFRTMFQTTQKDSSSRETITIDRTPYVAFYKLLNYLYTDHVTANEDDVVELYRGADMYDLPILKDICAEALLDDILSVENGARLLYESAKYDQLKRICLPFVQEYFGTITETEGMKLLVQDGELMIEVVKGKGLV